MMKAIKCEMCGSNDVIKTDGCYVCQSCGTKYSVEEAKKLLVEGVVKIDNSDKVEKLYQLARTARDNTDIVAARNYYEQIKVERPNDWEAAYFSLYYRLIDINLNEIDRSCDIMFNSLASLFTLISDYCEDINYKIMAVGTILIFNQGLAKIMYEAVLDVLNNHYISVNDSYMVQQYIHRTLAISNMLYGTSSLSNTLIQEYSAENKLKEEITACTVYSVQIRINTYRFLADGGDSNRNIVNDCMEIIWKYSPQYPIPTENAHYNQYLLQRFHGKTNSSNTLGLGSTNNGGCYIATAVYGSYNCPSVWTLRRYRDYHLAKTWQGRLFIRIYYAVSPTLVKLFGNTKWFNKLFKRKLNKMVDKLQKQGFENTPYQD